MQADIAMLVAEGILRGARSFWVLVDMSCGATAAVAFRTGEDWELLDHNGQSMHHGGFRFTTCIHCARAITLGGSDRLARAWYNQSGDDAIALTQRRFPCAMGIGISR